MELAVKERSKQIAPFALALGQEEFNWYSKNIKTPQLTSMEENLLKAQQANEKVSEMLSKLDNNKTNVRGHEQERRRHTSMTTRILPL